MTGQDSQAENEKGGTPSFKSPKSETRSKTFSWPVRVYYQHTDAGGMVFHANYLSFMECARTELLQSLGFDLGELSRRDHVLFVVHSAQIAYHKPALLNDALTVTASVKQVGRARLVFDQTVMRGEETLASAELSLEQQAGSVKVLEFEKHPPRNARANSEAPK